jgi:hypothetical protein
LNRTKENQVVDMIERYRKGSFKSKRDFLRQILDVVGEEGYKELFAMGN